MLPLPVLAAVELTLDEELELVDDAVDVEVVDALALWLELAPPLPPTELRVVVSPPFPAPPEPEGPDEPPLPPPLEEQAPIAPTETKAEEANQTKVPSLIRNPPAIP